MDKQSQSVKRNLLAGFLLRLVSFKNYGIECTSEGISVFGPKEKHIPYSDLSEFLKIKNFMGFAFIELRLKSASGDIVAGINRKVAQNFILAANSTYTQFVLKKFNDVEPQIKAISDALSALKTPKSYPSACSLHPIYLQANTVLGQLPKSIPSGILAPEQQEILDEVAVFLENPEKMREDAIEKFVKSKLSNMENFFDKIESNPLTPEQRLAVVTDEDATLVLAGAGSGKTSVIVAKAAYLLEQNICQPEEILLMAFGKEAAAEMASRIQERSGTTVDALTFHALGNKIIREVEGRAPALASYATDEAKLRKLLRNLLMTDVAQRPGIGQLILSWFSEFYWPYKSEWDFKTQDEYYQWVEAHDLRTLNGDRVKSYEEWEISNWLYRNGIKFEYEPFYEGHLPEDARSAYTPDFRLTESGVYIEHFGVRKSRGSEGSQILTTAPHINRERYLEDMEWKRRVHRDNGTVLIETYSFERVEGHLLKSLQEKLSPYVEIDPLPQNHLFNALSEMGLVDGFTQMLISFLKHYKSSRSSIELCHTRAEGIGDTSRSQAFLKIFALLFEAYQEHLGDQIDFEDMINMATDHVQSGRYKSPYRHLLLDEFQDISEGRARLLRALKAQHRDARIFAVGDDWQSIFRFAGSDIHLMRDFGQEFGGQFAEKSDVHKTVDLGRTFRSVDKIALPARRFVLQNPSQIEKGVIAASTAETPSILVAYFDRGQDDAAIKSALASLSKNTSNETSVLLLGRYNYLKPKNMRALTSEFPELSIRFMTAHGSKGLEADHVIILRATSDKMGFPSEIVDDPLLNLVLPKPEKYDHAEERRLFYVALTRARKSVTILADREKPSVFVRELLSRPEYETIEINQKGLSERKCDACGGRMLQQAGKAGKVYYICEHKFLCGEMLWPCNVCGLDLPVRSKENHNNYVCKCGTEYPACPKCMGGWLVERRSKYGKFKGCVKYPACDGKQK